MLIRTASILLLLLLCACVRQAPRPGDEPLLAEAESRVRASDYAGAAEIYQSLAEQSSAGDYYRLRAADVELRAGNTRAAQALLSSVDPGELEPADQNLLVLLKARLDLNQGRARDAMARLDALNYQYLEPSLAAHYHHLRASAYNQLGNMLESARERVELGRSLRNADAVRANNEAIYDALSRLPDPVLTGLQPPPPDTLGGWMALTEILKLPGAQREQALRGWHLQFPEHPADGEFLDGVLKKKGSGVQISPLKPTVVEPMPVATAAEPPPSVVPPVAAPSVASSGHFIGVLLPLSGTYASAAQAVRAGLTAAHDADPNPGKPELRFVDTQGGDVVAQYRQLAADGAQFVIGPLIKDELTRLAGSGEATVPVLALNQAPEVNADSIYQFGLTPEQEVEQSAGSAWFDGKQNALMLAPASSFGQRMISHFTRYWKSLGGKILAIKTYRAGGDDFSSPAKELLANASTDGGTADFVFLVADTRDAGLLRPHLEYQQSSPIPVYATSHLFNGRPDAPQNVDLSGVIFCDIPWLLNVDDTGPLSRRALNAAVEQTPDAYQRLIAMGIDAYDLIPQLPSLKSSSQSRFDGATGALTLQAGNRIQRQLHCAQFEGGALQRRGIAPLLQPGAPRGADAGPQ